MFFSAFLTRIYLVIATIFLVAVIAVWFIPRSDISVHAERRPTFDLTTFFDGKTVAYGIFEDRFGNLRRQFRVEIDAKREGNRSMYPDLHTHSLYSDGSETTRYLLTTAVAKGLSHLALTDHDCISGVRELWQHLPKACDSTGAPCGCGHQY